MKTNRRFNSALLVCLWLGAGCYNEPPQQLAVWSEFLDLETVRSQIPLLSRHNVDLYLKVEPGDLAEPLSDLVHQADAQGVAVRYWLQLPMDGIWINESNVAEFRAFAMSFLEWTAEQSIAPEWLIFDLEPSFDDAETLLATVDSGDLDALIELFEERHDPVRFETARKAMADLVSDLHDTDLSVMAVTLPWILDDGTDPDPDIQDIFNVPLDGIDWDQISVMTYRPTFGEILGVTLPAGYVARYASTAAVRYGDRAEVAIGNVGLAGRFVAPGYQQTNDLALDLSAALSGGATRVSVFSLDGMVETGSAERWLDALAQPTLRRPYVDLPTPLIRTGIGLLDRLADRLE